MTEIKNCENMNCKISIILCRRDTFLGTMSYCLNTQDYDMHLNLIYFYIGDVYFSVGNYIKIAHFNMIFIHFKYGIKKLEILFTIKIKIVPDKVLFIILFFSTENNTEIAFCTWYYISKIIVSNILLKISFTVKINIVLIKVFFILLFMFT